MYPAISLQFINCVDNANLFVLFPALLAAYKWLVCWLLQATANKVISQHQLGKDAFSAKNDSQVFFAKTLSLAFIEVSCRTAHPDPSLNNL